MERRLAGSRGHSVTHLAGLGGGGVAGLSGDMVDWECGEVSLWFFCFSVFTLEGMKANRLTIIIINSPHLTRSVEAAPIIACSLVGLHSTSLSWL